MTWPGAKWVVRAACAVGTFWLAACDGDCCDFSCPPGDFCDARLSDAESKTADWGSYQAVEQSDEYAKGSAVAGQEGPLGTARVSASVRLDGVTRATPDFSGVTLDTRAIESTAIPVVSHQVRGFSVNAAARLWRGFGNSGPRIGEADLVGGVTHLAAAAGTSSSGSAPELGIRLGLLEETRQLPGIAYTWTEQWMPNTSYTTSPVASDDGGSVVMQLENVDLHGAHWRLAASKELGRFGVHAGVGKDHVSGSLTIAASLSSPNGDALGAETRDIDFTRTVTFGGASVAVGGIRVAAEIGHLSGVGGPGPYTVNAIDPGRSRTFFNLGFGIVR